MEFNLRPHEKCAQDCLHIYIYIYIELTYLKRQPNLIYLYNCLTFQYFSHIYYICIYIYFSQLFKNRIRAPISFSFQRATKRQNLKQKEKDALMFPKFRAIFLFIVHNVSQKQNKQKTKTKKQTNKQTNRIIQKNALMQ